MKIEVQDLIHTYPSGETALNGISLVIEGTTPVAVAGQNGSGKTTLVKHFNRILSPTKGRVLIDGVSTTERSTAQWAKKIGYVFQNPDDQLFLNSVRKEFEFGPKRTGIPPEKIEKMLPIVADLCGLGDKLEIHPFDLTATEKKFCTIGSVMMIDPNVVIFDEPTCGQDIEGNNRLISIIRYLRNNGKLCITISHDMKFIAKNFERVVVLCKGQVLTDGFCKDVFAKPTILSQSFVSPPPICRVALGMGLKQSVFETEELVGCIVQNMKRRNKK
ncbi:MAG: energy-coupling factor ABC transporter ATP-binding protein [Oscillospiraceae bacterium]|nr:energy-coupling factor ABC transporter ATP-binding protein [Oscillospiraceae bacterium]